MFFALFLTFGLVGMHFAWLSHQAKATARQQLAAAAPAETTRERIIRRGRITRYM